MWTIVLIAVCILMIGSLIYLGSRMSHFPLLGKLADKNAFGRWVVRLIPLIVFAGFAVFDFVNSVIFLIHLTVFWIAADLLFRLFTKRGKEEKKPRTYAAAWIAVGVCVIYFIIGYFCAHQVFRKEYTITTEKDLGTQKLRVALIADCHIGSTFDGEGFARHLAEIQKMKPDVLVIVGDYVDDSTKKEDMLRAGQALGGFEAKYGVFYVYGNHDKGYYNSRGFTADELAANLRENGVTILEDANVMLSEGVCLIGRKDRSDRSRKGMAELMEGIDTSLYTIVLDHQPNDYKSEAEAGPDLVLSGHTHGGQMIPIGLIGRISGADDRSYGTEKRGNTMFLVTSGISCWALDFKTGTKSEYVIIDLVGNVK
ncbi:MAG: metallophosphoesterase [Lachnospiraceae bacterium]|nr:metallophosphoesterase [Lachnospiraceae bacterium]